MSRYGVVVSAALVLMVLGVAGGTPAQVRRDGKLGPFLERLVQEYGRTGETGARKLAEARGMKIRPGPPEMLVPVLLEPLAAHN
ncbi:MAG: hypothetical protein V3V67_19515, partial [Myxococcota bacterium]